MAAPEVRPLTAADLAALTREVDRARAAGEFRASSDDEAVYFLSSFGLDPGIAAGAFEGDELVGFVSAEYKVAVVRPDRRRRGIGRALVRAALDAERARGRADLLLGALPGDEDARAFLRATGFTFHSMLWDLDLPRDAPIGEPGWPAGHAVRPFDRSRDLEPWVALFNTAFADHATPIQLDVSFVTAGFDDPAFEDADTGLVEETATGELVGFCATAPIRRDGAVVPHGEIWTIGVRPDRQGSGLGRQLLRWGVRRLRAIGVADVSLSVNARNERALGLYESEGFIRGRTRERWALPVAGTSSS
ncbi:MAG TPA: GNAT family N-acetyltransferase [Candidatus Deferrimicrobium sp.]|nr:GNAT family N-acetyltransferase [Candidatus Deferrimicrobium sp.]